MRKIFTFILLLASIAVMANSFVTIEYLDAEAQQIELAKLHKFDLSDKGKFKAIDNEGNVVATKDVAQIKKISFTHPTAVESVNSLKLGVYPNPSMDEVTVEGVNAGVIVRLFTIDGRLLNVTVAESETARINVSSLAAGTYLLQAGNNVVKIIKQ